MLKIKVLNEQLTLNNFEYLEVKEYVPNLPLNLKIQILDSETEHRLIPSTSAKLIAIFQKRDSTELTVTATMLFNPDDRSMWQIALTAANTNDIIGSNVLIKLDFNGSSSSPDLSDSTDLRAGMAYGIMSKITFDGEC